MKILVVMKRFGANKDMVMDNFGRQIRIFEPLANKHTIHFFCPDYVKKESKIICRNGIKFIISPVSLFAFKKFLSSLNEAIKKEKYDVVIASTDPLIGILCHHYAKKFNVPLLYDLMDNFESYDAYKLPLVRYYDRKAIKDADRVLTVSETLKSYVLRFRKKPIDVIHNGVETKIFKPIDKRKARRKLNLPQKPFIIVYMGNLEKIKGSDILIKAFNKVKASCPNACLLLGSYVDDSIDAMRKDIIFRKFSKEEDVALGINSADVAVIPNPENNFTKYCFPYKLPEYMACNVPIVATNIGDVSLLMKKYKGSLCKPGDYKDLAEKIILKLKENKKINYAEDIKKLRWSFLANKLDAIIISLK